MSLGTRLRLDDVISSMPELGPTLSDGGYAWIVLVGSMAIQMTVPCISAMYGVVLGHLSINSHAGLDMWKEEIALTPILFTAFYNFADPWTRIIIKLATVPRLVGLIGVCLLSIGVLASGYLATGGMGAYFANVSAGAVMGIGGSFILVQTENVIRRNFRTRLRLALTLKEVATSLGFIFAPGFILALISRSSLQIGLLFMTCSFIPTALGTLVLRSPIIKLKTSPYTLLISEEDNELTGRVAIDAEEMSIRNNTPGTMFTDVDQNNLPHSLSSDGSYIYNYQDPDDFQDIFDINIHAVNSIEIWKEKIRIIVSIKFWIALVATLGCQTGALFLWIILPSLPRIIEITSVDISEGVALTVAAGLGTLIPSAASYWKPKTARWTSFCFGGASWLGSFVLLALSTADSFRVLILLAFAGGISVGGTSICLESAILDALGIHSAKLARTLISIIVGLSILASSFIRSPLMCLRVASAIQFVGGSYWVLVPFLGIIKAR